MDTSPEPPHENEAARSTPKGTAGPKLLFATVYPLVADTILKVVGFLALFGLLYDDPGYAVLFVAAVIVLVGGSHLWLQWILKGRDEPQPWQFPTILNTAMVAGVCVTGAPAFLDVPLSLPAFLVCMGLCLVGTFVFLLVKERERFVAALTAVLLVALVLAAVPWLISTTNQAEQSEQALQDAAYFPHVNSVLGSAGWEATYISTGRSTDTDVTD